MNNILYKINCFQFFYSINSKCKTKKEYFKLKKNCDKNYHNIEY